MGGGGVSLPKVRNAMSLQTQSFVGKIVDVDADFQKDFVFHNSINIAQSGECIAYYVTRAYLEGKLICFTYGFVSFCFV